jgi:autotransporter-associated beta strand protein
MVQLLAVRRLSVRNQDKRVTSRQKRSATVLAMAVAGLMPLAQTAQAADTTYSTTTTSGNWDALTWTKTGTTTTNTFPGGALSDAGNTARYTGAGTAGTTTLDLAVTIGDISVTNTGGWTINKDATPATHFFTLDNTGSAVNNVFGDLNASIVQNAASVGGGGLIVNPNILMQNTNLDIGIISTANLGGITIGGDITSNDASTRTLNLINKSAAQVVTITGNIGATTLTPGTTGAIAINNTSTGAGGVSLTTGTIGGAAGVGGAVTIANTSTGAGNFTISSSLAATVSSVTQASTTSTLLLSGANSNYAGTTTLTSGILKLGSTTALGGNAATLVINGGSLDVSASEVLLNTNAVTANNDFTFVGSNNLSLAGSFSLGSTAGARTITNTASVLTLNGIISNGSGGTGLTKAGAGALTLTATEAYTGSTTVNGTGILTVNGASGSIASSSGYTINGGTLTLDYTAGATVDRLNNSGAVTLSNGGTLIITPFVTSGTSTSETIGTFGIATGTSTTTIGATAGNTTTLAASAFSRSNNATALIRGASLNQSAATNVSRLTLADSGASLTLVGTNQLNNGGTADATQALKIVPYLIGGVTTADSGSNFLTYDSTLGLRVLTAAEDTALAAGSVTQANPINATAPNGTVTMTNPVTVNSLLFSNGAPQTLTGNATNSLTVASGAVANVASAVADTLGSGFVSLVLGNNEGVITTVGTGSLTIATPIDVFSSGTHSSTGALTKAGAGTVILSAANLYAGVTTINQGTLQIGNGTTGGLAASSGAVTVNAGATLGINQATGSTFANDIVQNGTLTTTIAAAGTETLSGNISGTGGVTEGTANTTLILSGTNSYSGTTTLSAGTLQFSGNAASSASAALALSTGVTVQLRGDAANLAAGTFSTATISIPASATVTFDVDQLTVAGQTGTKTITLSAPTIALGDTGGAGSTETFNVTGNNDGYTLVLPTVNMANPTSSTSNPVVFNASGANLTINGLGIGATRNAQWTFNGSNNISVGNFTSSGGSNSLVVNMGSPTATVSLTGTSNAFGGGGLTMTAGTLIFGSTFTAANATSLSGASGISGGTIDNQVTGGAAVVTGNATWAISGNFTYGSGSTTGGLNLGAGAVTLTNNPQITVAASTLTIGGIIGGGAQSLTKLGSGTLALGGVSTFSGGLNINVGTVQVSGAATLGTGTVTFGTNTPTNGTLDLNGFTVTVDGLAVGSGATAASQTIGNSSTTANAVLNFSTGTSTFGGTIQNFLGSNNNKTTGVTVASGNLTLSGTNTYTGATTVTTGTLNLTGSLTGATAIVVNGGNFAESSNGVIGSAAASLTVNGGIATLAGVNTYTGNTTLTSGTLNINSTTALGATASTLTINPTVNATIDSPNGDVTLANNNPITINGTPGTVGLTFTGAHNLNLGNGAVSLGSNRVFTLNSTNGSVLTFGGLVTNTSGAGQTTTVNGSGNTMVWAGYALTNAATNVSDSIQGTGNLIITGAVTNGASSASNLTYSGTGTLTLQGNNTNTGVTNVSSGTLALSGTNTSSGITITDGAKLRLISTGSNTAGSTSTAFGSGTLTVNSTPTFQLRADASTTFTIPNIVGGGGVNTFTFDVNNVAAVPASGNQGGVLTVSGSYSPGSGSDHANTTNVTGGNGYILKLGTVTAEPSLTTINTFNVASGLEMRIDTLTQVNGLKGLALLAFTGSGTSTVGAITSVTGSAFNTTISAGLLNLTGANTLISATGSAANGTVTMSGGTLNLGNAGALNTANAGVATLIQSGGGTIDNTGTGGSAYTTLAQNIKQTWNGSFAFTGTNSLNTGTGAVTLGATPTVTVNANSLTVGGAISGTGFGLTKAGAGKLVLTAGNGYTGPTNVNVGTLVVNGSLAQASTVTVAVGATLAGTATVTAGTGVVAGNVTVNGTVAVSNAARNSAGTAGTFTLGTAGGATTTVLSSGSTYQWGLANVNGTTPGTDWDLLNINEFTVGNTGDVTIKAVVIGSPGTAAPNTIWDVISTGTSVAAQTAVATAVQKGMFVLDTSSLNFANDVGASSFSVIQDPGNLNDIAIQVNAAPEPTSMMLLGLGVGGLALRRRRRIATNVSE